MFLLTDVDSKSTLQQVQATTTENRNLGTDFIPESRLDWVPVVYPIETETNSRTIDQDALTQCGCLSP